MDTVKTPKRIPRTNPSSRRFAFIVIQPRWHRSVGSDNCMGRSLLRADDSSSGSEDGRPLTLSACEYGVLECCTLRYP